VRFFNEIQVENKMRGVSERALFGLREFLKK